MEAKNHTFGNRHVRRITADPAHQADGVPQFGEPRSGLDLETAL